MKELITKIEQWAQEKDILSNCTPHDQILKTIEEVGELAHAIGKNDKELIKDAIGDVMVILIIQAKMHKATWDWILFSTCHHYGIAPTQQIFDKLQNNSLNEMKIMLISSLLL